MGNNMIPYTYGVGEKYTYFISEHYKLIENDKIEEGSLLNATNDSVDSYDYHLSKNGLVCFKKLLDCNRIHSFELSMDGNMEDIPDPEENIEDVDVEGLEYTDGNNRIVKIFNPKCIICLERDSEYTFKQCGHHCVCQECYQNKGDIDILKCVICRT